ncbi:MAG: radical SAM protein [Desulfobulbaceae bacterium]|nr:radical SAM protein [Desulfobulbaceae bacterium]
MGYPSYLQLYRDGTLEDRIREAGELLADCTVCPQECRVNRLEGELGICRVGAKARIASYGPHFGEEAPLVGEHGSGTIFFEGCNLLCVFCQNCDISHIDKLGDASAQAVDHEQLAEIMLGLQERQCHNINLVTPSHVVPQILAALPAAIERGLHLPLVYNSSGFDSVDTLCLLEGIVDIYMPDCKFISPAAAKRYTRARNYPEAMMKAVREMHRQVGDLKIDARGLAVRGLLVRHLVMPGHPDETEGILDFLANEISVKTYLNLMDQYRPCHEAFGIPPIDRPLSAEEYRQAMEMAEHRGLTNLDQRDWKRIMRLLGI